MRKLRILSLLAFNKFKMKKTFLFFTLAICFASGTYATAPINYNGLNELYTNEYKGEVIKSFDADIVVNVDNSISIREKIVYSAGGISKHGIYRDIYPYSAEKKKMDISIISVTDEAGNSYKYTREKVGKNLRLKIGDPDITFTGEKIYIISYIASKAVSQLGDIDEIYWNVTGNEWTMPILKASAHVTLPENANASQTACYYGARGSINKCEAALQNGSSYTFATPRLLLEEEGLTVAVGFNKGVVVPYTLSDNMLDLFYKYLPYIIAAALPIIAFIFSYRYWRKNGRDERKTNVIVAEYDVPDGLTPLESVAIVEERLDSKIVSAEIIYLATKGYIKIKEIEIKNLLIFKSKDYELTKLKEYVGELNESDQNLLHALFKGGNTVRLSDLKNVFYKSLKTIIDPALRDLVDEGYYKNLGKMKSGLSIFAIVMFTIWAAGIFGVLPASLLLNSSISGVSFFVLGIVLSGIIIIIFYYLSPAKTEKGVSAKEKILGLKEYMQIAEKDRIIFANAPESKPEIFEKLLPYAMALGVADIWAKEFKDIYMNPPSWYSGSTNSTFNSVILSGALGDFSSSSLAASTPPSSRGGGSSGGGFSGGGGGGGGGGSW